MTRLINRRSTRLALAAFAAFAGSAILKFAMPVSAAQARGPAPQWTAWLGCWASEGSDNAVCVIPANNPATVELVTVARGQIVFREFVDASGEHKDSVKEGCNGWESGQWSDDGQRLYLRSEYHCGNGAARTGTELFAISPTGEWIDSSSITMGGNTGVRTTLRHAVWPEVLPAELAASISQNPATRSRGWTVSLGFTEIVDTTRHLDPAVVEAWLSVVRPKLKVDAKRLADLDRKGVPASVIDVIVALAYPTAFRVEPAAVPVTSRTIQFPSTPGQVVIVEPPPVVVGPSYVRYPSYDCRFDPNFWEGCGGWRPARDVIVITGGSQPQPHGRVTKEGYQSGDNRPSQGRKAEPERTSNSSQSSTDSSTSSSSESDPKKPAAQPATSVPDNPPDPPRTARPR